MSISFYLQMGHEHSGCAGRDPKTCSSSAPDGVRAPGSKCAGKGTRTGGGLVDLAGETPIDVAVVVVVGLEGKKGRYDFSSKIRIGMTLLKNRHRSLHHEKHAS